MEPKTRQKIDEVMPLLRTAMAFLIFLKVGPGAGGGVGIKPSYKYADEFIDEFIRDADRAKKRPVKA